MRRKKILKAAIQHTCGERDVEYGPPRENLESIAMFWTTYVSARYGAPLFFNAEDVAQMMVLLKMARTFRGQPRSDTFEDEAAFAAIAGELSEAIKP